MHFYVYSRFFFIITTSPESKNIIIVDIPYPDNKGEMAGKMAEVIEIVLYLQFYCMYKSIFNQHLQAGSKKKSVMFLLKYIIR